MAAARTSGPDVTPLGRVLRGPRQQRHATDSRAFARRNVIGTYLHGPLLPKNAWFADWLIRDRARARGAARAHSTTSSRTPPTRTPGDAAGVCSCAGLRSTMRAAGSHVRPAVQRRSRSRPSLLLLGMRALAPWRRPHRPRVRLHQLDEHDDDDDEHDDRCPERASRRSRSATRTSPSSSSSASSTARRSRRRASPSCSTATSARPRSRSRRSRAAGSTCTRST